MIPDSKAFWLMFAITIGTATVSKRRRNDASKKENNTSMMDVNGNQNNDTEADLEAISNKVWMHYRW